MASAAPPTVMNAILGGACAVFALIAAVGFPLSNLRLDLRGAAGSIFAAVALLLLYLRYRNRDLPRLRDTALLTFWGVLLSTLYLLPMYVIARRPLPFRDDALRAADLALGFDAPRTPALDLVYDSLQVLCLLALMVPPLAGKAERTRTMLLSLVVASFATLASFAFFRAVGPWESFGFTPSDFQRNCGDSCRMLASGRTYVVDLRRPDPLIAFPSWHAILAVLAAITLARIRYLAVPAIAWGALVVISTVTTGWHYVVDTIAGVAFAAIAWVIAAYVPLGTRPA